MKSKYLFFRVTAVVVACLSALLSVKGAASLASPAYIQYTSGSGAANPTCTLCGGIAASRFSV